MYCALFYLIVAPRCFCLRNTNIILESALKLKRFVITVLHYNSCNGTWHKPFYVISKEKKLYGKIYMSKMSTSYLKQLRKSIYISKHTTQLSSSGQYLWKYTNNSYMWGRKWKRSPCTEPFIIMYFIGIIVAWMRLDIHLLYVVPFFLILIGPQRSLWKEYSGLHQWCLSKLQEATHLPGRVLWCRCKSCTGLGRLIDKSFHW